jgi:hypothetical protein
MDVSITMNSRARAAVGVGDPSLFTFMRMTFFIGRRLKGVGDPSLFTVRLMPFFMGCHLNSLFILQAF